MEPYNVATRIEETAGMFFVLVDVEPDTYHASIGPFTTEAAAVRARDDLVSMLESVERRRREMA